MVLPQKVKRSLEGFIKIYLRWWKRKVIRGMFKYLEENYGGFERTHDVVTLGWVWNPGRRREYRREGKVKPTKLEI